MAELEFIQGPTMGQKVPLDGSDVTIGRDAHNTVVVADTAVSRNHARLYFQNGMWLVADLGSSNGTYVNGARLAGSPAVLNMGDVVQMGPAAFRIQDAASAMEPTQAWTGTPIGQPQAQYPVVQQPQAQYPAQQPQYTPTPFGEGQPLAQPYQPYPPYGPAQPQQPMIMISGQKNLTWLWIILALIVIGPCGIICLGSIVFVALPFIMVIGGLVCGIVGLYNFKRFNGHPGWEGSALKGLVMAVGGFAACLLGLVWLGKAWFDSQPPAGPSPEPQRQEQKVDEKPEPTSTPPTTGTSGQ